MPIFNLQHRSRNFDVHVPFTIPAAGFATPLQSRDRITTEYNCQSALELSGCLGDADLPTSPIETQVDPALGKPSGSNTANNPPSPNSPSIQSKPDLSSTISSSAEGMFWFTLKGKEKEKEKEKEKGMEMEMTKEGKEGKWKEVKKKGKGGREEEDEDEDPSHTTGK